MWVGNADGEGRPGLTGYRSAAPLLFRIFEQLPRSAEWFRTPSGLVPVRVCARFGMRAGVHCATTELVSVPSTGAASPPCAYCTTIHCDAGCRYRVNADCESPDAIRHERWFLLPPAMEWFYGRRHASYRTAPPVRRDCAAGSPANNMACVYPKPGSEILVPRELDGEQGRVVFSAAHRLPGMEIFWHLDDTFVGSTTHLHQLPATPPPGRHILTLVDELGERLQRSFVILGREPRAQR